jgi:HAD superfamily hydrolase (TIGR01509 family)
MAIEAVIFDLDGTLSSFNLDYKALRGEVREYLMQIGIPASLLGVNESLFEMLSKVELYMKNNGKTEQTFLTARSKCLTMAEKYEMDAATSANLMPGALETLKELKKMNLKLGLCTTSSEAAVAYILKRFKIFDYFQVVVPRNMVKRVKPDTEQFRIALKSLEVRPINTVIVGDSTVDMESAKELKAVAIALPTGYSTPEQLMKFGANYLITSLSDLSILIKELKKEEKN